MSGTTATGARRKRRVKRKVRTAAPAPKRRGLGFVVLMAIVVLVVAAGPMIAAKSPLKDTVVAALVSDIDGTLKAERLDLGWLSPTRLHGVTLVDAGDDAVMTVEMLTAELSVFGWLIGQQGLGEVTVDGAEIDIVVDEGGSNLERVFAPWIEDEESDGGMAGTTVRVRDANVTVRGPEDPRTGRIEEVTLVAELPASPNASIQCVGSFALAADGSTGVGEVALIVPQSAGGAGSLEIAADGLPLAFANVVGGRWGMRETLAGRGAANLQCHWQGPLREADEAEIDGNVTLTGVAVDGGRLADERLELRRIEMPCRARMTDGVVEFDQLAVVCDLGTARYVGTMDLEKGVVDALTRQTYELSGQVDLAGIAEQLEGLLHVREGTRITAGMVEVAVRSDGMGVESKLQGVVDVTAIEAVDRGQAIRWERPLRADFAGRYVDGRPVIDSLAAKASFVDLQSSGTAEQFAIDARLDLDRLREELGRFLEIETHTLGGAGNARLNWSSADAGGFRLTADADLANVTLPAMTGSSWHEDRLVARAELEGVREDASLKRIDRAVVQVSSSADFLRGQLVAPVDVTGEGAEWPIHVSTDGDLGAWLPRLEAVIGPLEGWGMRGQGQLEARLVMADGTVDVQSLEGSARDFAMRSPSLRISEPAVGLKFSGAVRPGVGEIEVRTAELSSSTVQISARDVRGDWNSGATSLRSGEAAWRADLGRMQQWFVTEGPAERVYQGTLEGSASIVPEGSNSSANWQAVIEPLVIRGAGSTEWREPKISVSGQAKYDADRDTLTIERAELASATMGATAHGQVARFSDRRDVHLDGAMQYDMQRVAAWLRDAGGIPIEMQGRDSSPFTLQGSLGGEEGVAVTANVGRGDAASGGWYESVEASASAGWETAAIHGFRMGPGRIVAQLSHAELSIEPLDVAVNGGRMRLAPHLMLRGRRERLTIGSGRVLEQVQVTPAMCDQALGYVAPALAGATDVQGAFSLDLAQCDVPLAEPAQGHVTGQLTVHSIDVSAGPLVRELALVLGRAPSVQLRRSSVVDFQWAEGRMYHRGLELEFPEVTVRTHGSVGMDRTLAMVAEMPVPRKWIGSSAVGRSLEGKTLRLPIHGTLDSPQVDRSALDALGGQMLRETTTDLLRGEIMRGLNKLLPPEGQ